MFHAWFLFGNDPLRVYHFFHVTFDLWNLVRGVEAYKDGSIVSSFSLSLFIHQHQCPSLNLVHSFLLCKLGKNLWLLLSYFPDQTLIKFLLWELQEKKIDRSGREKGSCVCIYIYIYIYILYILYIIYIYIY